MRYDVVIIGGGAAGLCAAIRLKQKASALRVAIAEQLPRVGKKLIVTGNGRCNITNRVITPARYHGAHPEFCKTALSRYSKEQTERFFADIGVVFTYDEVGRAYPYSLQASSVVDALRFAAEENGVEIFTETKVCDLTRKGKEFLIQCEDGQLVSRYVIIAAGLFSGGDKLGSNGSMFRLLKAKGYPVVNAAPAIVQLKSNSPAVRSLKGIKVEAEASLLQNGTLRQKESGEVLFCDYGLSGPPILQLSRAAGREERGLEISLNLMPQYEKSALLSLLSARVAALSGRPAEEFFTGLLNKRVGQAILKECDCFGKGNCRQLQREIPALADRIFDWRFSICGTTGFLNSQVTSGGLSTESFDEKTMMSRRDYGLFAAGEILDIDGDCGGFNLQWAWSSALCAADSICALEKQGDNV